MLSRIEAKREHFHAHQDSQTNKPPKRLQITGLRTDANPNTDGFDELRLSHWEEVVGRCTAISRRDENTTITLKVCGRPLEVVIPAVNQESFPLQLIGQRLGILRTDELFVVRKI